MNATHVPVIVITGQLAAGKSSLARALLARFSYGLHVDVDGIREMVTSGLASPLEWTDETTRQFGLAIEASAAMAAIYHSAGFAVAIEGAIDPPTMAEALARSGLGGRWIGVELHPRPEVALERNRSRDTKPFDTSILGDAIGRIDADISAAPVGGGWTRLDNSDESLEDTAERVMALWRRQPAPRRRARRS